VSNGGCKTLLGGVRFGRPEKRSQALLGSNLTRDIQADGAPMARPASGGKSSEAVAFEPHWTPERIFEKILRRSRISPIDLCCARFSVMIQKKQGGLLPAWPAIPSSFASLRSSASSAVLSA
jgi:hypothetical protein